MFVWQGILLRVKVFKMKKIIVILLCVFITGVLMSCEKTNMKSTSTTGDEDEC